MPTMKQYPTYPTTCSHAEIVKLTSPSLHSTHPMILLKHQVHPEVLLEQEEHKEVKKTFREYGFEFVELGKHARYTCTIFLDK
ncbi:hypothetical protein BDR22DRAFT_872487 [Usnea florida]